MKKLVISSITLVLANFFVILPAFAHVVVKPEEAGVGSFQIFSLSVPNEQDNPIVALKLLIPEGLTSISPTVKPGWTIEMKKNDEGDTSVVTEIDWTGGSIPAEQRDDFSFSAKVPSEEKTLSWKAYQTYADGQTVSWDQDPTSLKNLSNEEKEKLEGEGKGPLSQTKIVNDLAEEKTETASAPRADIASLLSVVALGVAVTAIIMQRRQIK